MSAIKYLEKYNESKRYLENSIQQNTNTIILYGNSGNGKSYLTHEFSNTLETNDYNIYSPDKTYSWGKDDFLQDLEENHGKKIQHFLFNPFDHWDISCPSRPIDVINMTF